MFIEILFLVSFFTCSIKGREILDHYDTQLKLINKPALKSFETEYGDIIDCIDIYKQLAFDHPLLKNHTIQMRPETTRESEDKDSKNYLLLPENMKCPEGSVPIKRATREDLEMAESIKSMGGLKNPMVNNIFERGSFGDPSEGHESAMLVYKASSFGARAALNVWSPVVGDQQFSLAGMGLAKGPLDTLSTIQAGWMVHNVVSPKASRLFTYFSGDGYRSGCFNTLCPGFVQVSTEIALGLVLPPSTYNGLQTEMFFSIYQEQSTKNWWLTMAGKYVGYWSGYVVPGMLFGAEMAWWGGEAYSPPTILSPSMGSGHFPEEGYLKSAYVQQLMVMKNRDYGYDHPIRSALQVWVDKSYCYNAIHYERPTSQPGAGHYMYFGGPGNCTFR